MSQWQNQSWPPPPQSAALPRSVPEKSELYPYSLPNQKYIRHPYLPAEYESSLAGDHQYPNRQSPNVNHSMPHPGEHHQLPVGALPYSQPPLQRAVGPDGQYPSMTNQQFPIPPGEFTNHSNYVATKQWDHLDLGQPQGGSGEPSVPKKQWSKRGSELGADSETSSQRGSTSSTSGRSGLDSTAQKVTKRSRMGCLTCRLRKKRCCETRPKCSECQRLRLNCNWPKPGTEHKNKPKEVKNQENMIDHDIYGPIKVLRGIVEYRSN
ncbi:CIC11C00000005045 [Sungouiella intermedia]|uniref:CIC11C00000005045 n=1 Tax=Sungouiella intermedia TaxID=45354 RepID=A0A1L0BAW0_9ASCO|nr:CIC11C00000005045 [[Candida] intermedia]